MKPFVFIIARTPSQFSDPLRDELFKICIHSLELQKSQDWEAIVVGEEDAERGNIHFIKSDAISKRDKIIGALGFINSCDKLPKYLIRFDDDDIISPIALHHIIDKEFDCYADKYHYHYDIQSGRINSIRFPWLPNTVIHKYEHAISDKTSVGIPLLLCDHSRIWHKYYSDKNILYSERQEPLYVRVLSPNCQTFKKRNSENISAEETMQYKNYLEDFGLWKKKELPIYKHLMSELEILSKSMNIHSDLLQKSLPDKFLFFTKHILRKSKHNILNFISK